MPKPMRRKKQRIEEAAYQRRLERGKPLWRALDDWLVAEARVGTLLYRVDPPAAQWGEQVTLKVIRNEVIGGEQVSSVGDFGPFTTLVSRVMLIGAGATKIIALPAGDWSTSSITLRLPPFDAGFAPRRAPHFFGISVDTVAGAGFLPYPADDFIILPTAVSDLRSATTFGNALSRLLAIEIHAPQMAAPSTEPVQLEPLAPLTPDGRLNTVTATLKKAATFDSPDTVSAALLKDLVVNGLADLTFSIRQPVGPFNKLIAAPLEASLDTLPQTLVSEFMARPNFVAQEASVGDKSAAAWKYHIELDVIGSRLPGANQVTAVLQSAVVTQLPLEVPTVVAMFDKRNFDDDGMEALFCVRPGPAFLNGYRDRSLGGNVEDVEKLVGVLATVTNAVSQLGPLFGNDALGWAHFGDLDWFVKRIKDRVHPSVVISGESEHNDLGTYSPGWYDRISSLFIIGVPDGATTFQLFEQKNQGTPHELHVRVPRGFLAASYFTLHESAFKRELRGSFSSNPVVPDPGVDQEGRADHYPFGSFGNMAKSFRWV